MPFCRPLATRPCGQLVASLDGCAGGRAGEIVRAAGLGRKACRQVDAAGAARLLKAARAVAKPVNPKRLGAVGAGPLPQLRLRHRPRRDELRSPPLKRSSRSWSRLGLAQRERKNAAAVSVNRTPVAAQFNLQRNKANLNLFGCGLANTVAKTQSDVTLWLNVTTPYMPITSDGKEPNLEPFADAIATPSGRRSGRRGARAPAACRSRTWCSSISPMSSRR